MPGKTPTTEILETIQEVRRLQDQSRDLVEAVRLLVDQWRRMEARLIALEAAAGRR